MVHEYREVWNIRPPSDENQSFAMGIYGNEIRECIKNCGMAPQIHTRSNIVPAITITPNRISRSTYNRSNAESSLDEVVVGSEVVSPVQGTRINLNFSVRFISLEYLRQLEIKQLATLEYIIYSMDNGNEVDTQYLTMPADVTMADLLNLDSRRKVTMKRHIIEVRNNLVFHSW